MSTDDSHLVVLLCSDLMLTSSVGAVAAAEGFRFLSTADPEEAKAAAQHAPSARLLIDFGLPGLDITRFAAELPEFVLRNAVAYGPHVHTLRIEAARAAGIGTVTSRGNFTSTVRRWIGPAEGDQHA